MSYATNLCELMQKSGVSSYKLAKDIGVHTSTVTNWKEGKVPKVEHLQAVATYFGTTVDSLLSDNPIQQGDVTTTLLERKLKSG